MAVVAVNCWSKGGPWLTWAETANKIGEEMEWLTWVSVGRVRGGSDGGLLGVASATVLRARSLPATGHRWLLGVRARQGRWQSREERTGERHGP